VVLPFGCYAQRYAEYLQHGGHVRQLAAAVVMAQAAGRLAVFLCTDPYLPDYGRAADVEAGTPYAQRLWLPELRSEGCHRVVLAEEVTRLFRSNAFTVELVEVDQLDPAGAHCRRLQPLGAAP
jgi:hypothetical protein